MSETAPFIYAIKPTSPLYSASPLEIRDHIYSYFVTIDQTYEHEGDFYDGEKHLGGSDLSIPCDQVPEEHSRRLIAEAQIHLKLGLTYENNSISDIDGNESEDSFLFAYHPFQYNFILLSLAEKMIELDCDSIKIEATPATLSNSSLFIKLMEPLCVLRGMRNVSFKDGVEHCPALQLLEQDMKRPLIICDQDEAEDRIDVIELIRTQQYHQRLGRNAELLGHYSDAMCHYRVGGDVRDISPDTPGRLDGSPEYNTCNHIAIELKLGFSRSVHRYLAQLKKSAPNSALHDFIEAKTIHSSIDACCQSLDFVRIEDCQRREAHLYRAFALFRLAEYLRALPEPDRQSSPYVPRDYYLHYRPVSEAPHTDSSEAACSAAARDLLYAKNATPSHDILADLDEDDKATYHSLNFFTGPFTQIARHDVPLLGTWSGDPMVWDLWEYFFPQRYLLMKLFRLRLKQEPDDKVEDIEELEKQYAAEGITWDWESGDLEMISDTW
ncbi:hypothetical protein PG996_015945 [Apiospora saccharicola]|uniref:Uncharacterized protein n=1 Tax=Apiospora saccharicola TaxID=335842 RepID=A0ABR1TMJ2_9PEZI